MIQLSLPDPIILRARDALQKARKRHHGQAAAFRDLTLAVARSMAPEIAQERKESARRAGKSIVRQHERKRRTA